MARLAARHCTPVKKGSKPISPAVARSLVGQIKSYWRLDPQSKALESEFTFQDFRETIEFVNAISWIANTENHHPELEISYNRCKVTFTTHAANGLTVNDFICAAKIDALFKEGKPIGINNQNTGQSQPKTSFSGDNPDNGRKPKPVEKVAAKQPVNTQELSFDFKEAEELLSIKNTPVEEEPNTDDEIDEIELIEPVIVPETPPEPEPAQAPSEKPAEKPGETVNPQAAAQTDSAKKQDKTPQESASQPDHIHDLMATVILPPGMQNVKSPAADEDEESTVIIPEDEQPDNQTGKDHPGVNKARDKRDQPAPLPSNTAPPKPIEQPPDDPDEIKTVIFSPDLFDNSPENEATIIMSGEPDELIPEREEKVTASPENKPKAVDSSDKLSGDKAEIPAPANNEDEATVILSASPLRPTSPAASPAKPEHQKETPANTSASRPRDKNFQANLRDADEVGTMILSSNPHNKPRSPDASSQKQAPDSNPTDDQANRNNQDIRTQQISKVNPEFNSAPEQNQQESDNGHMATMIMSPAEVEALTSKPPKQKIEPEIEEDDTLVMHINSFKKITPNKK